MRLFLNLLAIAVLVMVSYSWKEEFLENEDKTNLIDATQWESETTSDLFLNDIYGEITQMTMIITPEKDFPLLYFEN